MNNIIRVKEISTSKEREHAFRIRMRVFVKEQGVAEDIELDTDDRRAIHLLAVAGARAVGTARVVIRGERAKIGRMAVLKSQRGKGIGKKLLSRAIAAARRHGARQIYLHAQVAAIGFYESMDFHCASPVFDEAGIPHRKMVLYL